jgi:DNA helicase II / ATP-dependent DNA helicase PcrA
VIPLLNGKTTSKIRSKEEKMPWDRNLRGVHREIAAEHGSPVHVLAGPGTGKTFAMMRRIARIIEEGVEPRHILAVTFTRTAARDLREQLASLSVPGAEEVRATTLHSLYFSVLGREDVFAVTGRTARPLLSYEIEQLVNDLSSVFGGKRRVRILLEAYEAAWARMQNEEPGRPQTEEDADFQARLLDWLRYHRAMLIGELVPIPLTFLRDNPAIEIFPRFEHVLVDEYQDLNRSDQTLVSLLAHFGTLTVIGDDNQSIYSFRYANPEGIRAFPDEHPATVAFVIEQCRRCPPNIVDISNSLIAHDQRRMREAPLQADRGRQLADVYVVQHRTLDDEVEANVDFIDNCLRTNPDLPPGQVLVLATRRLIGHRIRRALIDRGRNSLSYFFEDELENPVAAEGYCLLKLLVTPQDRAAFRGWLGIGNNSGHARGYARLRELAQRMAVEPRAALEAVLREEVQLAYSGPLLARLRLLNERLTTIQGLEGLPLARSLFDAEDTEVLDIRLLAERLALDNPEPEALLEALTEAITQPELPGSNSDIVRVMSLHKSKGLTASVVVVCGCVAGALPSINTRATPAEQDAQLEEQRRLFYVAITRASTSLVVSASTSMPVRDAMASGIQVRSRFFENGVAMARTAASPFLNELGPATPNPINTAVWRQRAGF